MMTITNIKKRFFRNKIQKNLLFLVLVLFLTGCTKTKSFQIKSFKTASGWGYTIANSDKIVIKQSIIPVISEIKSFSTEEDALKLGNLVIEKLNNDLSPTVTKNDLILLKIKF